MAGASRATGSPLTGSFRLALGAVAALSVLLAAAPAYSYPPNPSPDDTAEADGRVLAIAYNPAGSVVYIGGAFTHITDVDGSIHVRNHVAAIDVASGALVRTWDPNVDKGVNALAVSPDGSRVYLGGAFGSIGGLTAYKKVAAVDAVTGAPLSSFRPKVPALVKSMALSGDGLRLYIGGKFTSVNGVPRLHLAALNTADGSLLASFNPSVEQLEATGIKNTCRPRCPVNVAALAFAPDGSDTDAIEDGLYLGGAFGLVNGVSRESAAQVHPISGALMAWDPRVWHKESFNRVWDLAPYRTGSRSRVLICGDFYFVGGERHPNMAVVTARGGGLASGFVATTDGAIVACEASTGGSALYLGGHFGKACHCEFAKYVGTSRLHVAALDSLYGELLDWDPKANSPHGIFSMDLTPTKLAIGGDFTITGGKSQARFAQYSGSP